MKMKISRPQLMKAFHGFVSRGSGIVVGEPGAGKTYTLRLLVEQCLASDQICVFLPVDRLIVEAESDLKEELGYKSSMFVEFIASQKLEPGKRGLLIVDALDAAKSEKAIHTYLTAMSEVHSALADSWSIICSIRRYDAKKCAAVQSLFPATEVDPSSAGFEGAVPDIHCRHFLIPALTDEDIHEAADAVPGLLSFFDDAPDDLKQLLRVPFNLWLLENIVLGGTQIEELGRVQSEVELLDFYWQRRISANPLSESLRSLLGKAARTMTEARSLTVKRSEVYESDLDQAWDEAMSLDVLEDVTETGQRICFAHNILFDYAVSILLIEETANGLVEFLTTDPSRPLFLRPSIDYFLARLWRNDSATFWQVFWILLESDDPRLRLFARLLPTSAIIRGLRQTSDIDPLFIRRVDHREEGDEAILRLLQALKAQDTVNDVLWAPILERFSQDCSDRFVAELGTSVTYMQERVAKSTGGEHDTILAACGNAARNMLKWVWERRKAEDGKRFDGIGSTWLVPLVAKTFAFDPAAARTVLEPVWALVDEEAFPIDYLYRITTNIKQIMEWDSGFVARTYEVVFSYQEASDEATSMGTPIMPITSNRRQDYRMCHYNLKRAFPSFLKAAPLIACTTAVRCLTPYILGSHVVPYLRDGVNINETIETFTFRGREVRYIPDHSYIWAQTRYPEEPIEIADAIFKYLKEKVSANDTEAIRSVLDVFCENIAGTYFWRELFLVGAEFPQAMVPLMWDLALSSSLQVENDTVHELGAFLTAAAPVMPAEDLLQIERSLLALPSSVKDDQNPELYSRRRDRLLGCIGIEHLQEAESKQILEELMRKDAVPDNEPLAKFESWSKPYSEKEYLEEQGVDLSRSENQVVLDFFEPLASFTSEWQNKKPSQEAIDKALPLLEKAWSTFLQEGDRDPKMIERLLTKCGECSETMVRGFESHDVQGFTLCREILLKCASDASPEPDEEYDSKYSHAGWSPAPRNEAAQGLPWLAARAKDDAEIIAAIEKLTKDPVPSVRYLVTTDLFRTAWNYTDEFWKMAEERAKEETNKVVQHALCHTLSYAIQKDEAKACEILDRLIQPAFEDEEETELLDSMVNLLMGLYIVRDNQWAASVADRILKKPRGFRKALHRAMLDALSYITPMHITIPDQRPHADKAKAWVFYGIDAASSELAVLTKLPAEEIDKKVQEIIRSLYSSIDEVIMRFYFAAGLFEGGKECPPVTDDQRRAFYEFIKPVLDKVIEVCDHKNGGLLFASTAHDFMELLNGVLVYDPKHVLALAHKVAKIGTGGGYNLNSMAVREVVKLVESILANHRVDVREGDSLEDLLGILDIFSDVGWPDALKLVWRLDEVFR